MNDFVVRRLDTDTFNSMYFNGTDNWVNTSEQATKLHGELADTIKEFLQLEDSQAYFDLILRKDSHIAKLTNDLTKL